MFRSDEFDLFAVTGAQHRMQNAFAEAMQEALAEEVAIRERDALTGLFLALTRPAINLKISASMKQHSSEAYSQLPNLTLCVAFDLIHLALTAHREQVKAFARRAGLDRRSVVDVDWSGSTLSTLLSTDKVVWARVRGYPFWPARV